MIEVIRPLLCGVLMSTACYIVQYLSNETAIAICIVVNTFVTRPAVSQII